MINRDNCTNEVRQIIKEKDNTVYGQIASDLSIDGLARWTVNKGALIEG